MFISKAQRNSFKENVSQFDNKNNKSREAAKNKLEMNQYWAQTIRLNRIRKRHEVLYQRKTKDEKQKLDVKLQRERKIKEL